MRILILGNNKSALSFLELFNQNKNNIVFSTILNHESFIDFTTNYDIVDFCLANEIDLVLITENKHILSYLGEELIENNISVFAPSFKANEITYSKTFAKKFMHKNNILTPKFFIAEKIQSAYEFAKINNYPLVIKPDIRNSKETVKFAQTLSEYQKYLENLFQKGAKKVLIENYIEGKSITVWTISDGFKAEIIGTSAKYQDELAVFEPDFISDDIKNEIKEKIINPTITALSSEDKEYIGILGFDIILDKQDIPYLLDYHCFFDDLNVDFYTKDEDFIWEDIFNSVIIGDIFLKYDFSNYKKFMMTFRNNENKIDFIQATNKTNLYRYLKELDFDLKNLKEAENLWKY